jgi:inosose dehydratase
MEKVKFGCQTYTWQMSYEKYSDALDHIMDVSAASGFAGIEAEVCMLGKYRTEPVKLAESLSKRKLALGAICLVCDWRGSQETDAERAEADRVIAYLKQLPSAMLALCQMPGKDRADLRERQEHCIICCNEIGKRAVAAGVPVAFHPNSPGGSVFRIQEDYALLLDRLNTEVVGFAPDAGHIAKGGMNVVEMFRQYASVIRHVHYKDMTAAGAWAEMGKGSIDFTAITDGLIKSGYKGWIMIEDESPLAETNPDEVTRLNGIYLKQRSH